MGNEFVFQMLAQQNVEVFNEVGVKKIVATCPHCFNTLKNEYGALGGEYEVVPPHRAAGPPRADRKADCRWSRSTAGITFHDPCYLGRHNRVFAAPRALINEVGWAGGRGTSENHVTEMPRNSERSFCCGAGGARMWMEERIGKRINIERVEEALTTGAKTIAVGCPFCSTMLGDGVTAKKSSGEAEEDVEVVDVATVLLRSIKSAG